MEKQNPTLKNAWPYQKDKMNLPVADVDTAIHFYIDRLGFTLISQSKEPYPSAILERDGIQFGLSENGGDPEQDGCFFEVDGIDNLFSEFKENGLEKISPAQVTKQGETLWKQFFVIAPDGLCYCFAEKQD